jgi:hypothetical protein
MPKAAPAMAARNIWSHELVAVELALSVAVEFCQTNRNARWLIVDFDNDIKN